jgi:hypothetical protein
MKSEKADSQDPKNVQMKANQHRRRSMNCKNQAVDSVFYLKMNSTSEFALMCLNHWLDIVKACESQYYIVCDNDKLKSAISDIDGSAEFIPSHAEARDACYGLLAPRWINAGAALLTPFFHAKKYGFSCIFNIDADDTAMLCEAHYCAEALKKAKEYAEINDIGCFSLDMHSSPFERFYSHWTFGITYMSLDIDYIKMLEQYRNLIPEFQRKDMLRAGNVDEAFYNMGYAKLINIGTFCVENLYFRHHSWEMHQWKDKRFLIKKISDAYIYNWRLKPNDIENGLPIAKECIPIDVGLEDVDCLQFLDEKPSLSKWETFGLSANRKINMREEFSKTFALFRENINTPIYLFGGYNFFPPVSEVCRYLTGFDLMAEISGFIDNDPMKQGRKWRSYPIYSLSDIPKESLIIITGSSAWLQIERQLINMGFIHNYNYIYSYHFEILYKRAVISQTRTFQNRHRGERCFICGNGSTLTPEDLEILHNHDETVFASNNFYKMFTKTTLRPKYYFIADNLVLDNPDDVFNNREITVFVDLYYRNSPGSPHEEISNQKCTKKRYKCNINCLK